MEKQLKLENYITRADVNEAVKDEAMSEKQALDYVTDTVAHEYFASPQIDSSDDSSDGSDEDTDTTKVE